MSSRCRKCGRTLEDRKGDEQVCNDCRIKTKLGKPVKGRNKMLKWLKRIFIGWCILTISYITWKEVNRLMDWCAEGENRVEKTELKAQNDR